MVEFNDVYIEKLDIPKENIIAYIKEECEINDIFTLEEIKEFCSMNYGPEECFDNDALTGWADENGFSPPGEIK